MLRDHPGTATKVRVRKHECDPHHRLFRLDEAILVPMIPALKS
jgi:hypothetical protein